MTISKHISYEEATFSQTAARKSIPNTPSKEALTAMTVVAEKCFEPIREHFKVPLRISSFYRSKELNKAIGGSTTSQHCFGEAIDIQGMGGVTNKDIFEWALRNLKFDQMIAEFPVNGHPQWIHISYTTKRPLRQQVLVAVSRNGKTSYQPYNGNIKSL